MPFATRWLRHRGRERRERRIDRRETGEKWLIAAENLGKRFDAVAVLRSVSLGVALGEVVCVVGPSGSGKTTLLRCLALLETPSEGRVTMDGVTIGDAQPTPRSGVPGARAVRHRHGVPALQTCGPT